MGLGILEDRVMDHVPGTTRYFDDPERPQYAPHEGVPGLKCDNSGPVPIILVPQPSDDPNDPLNWPLWKRDVITLILSITAIFGTALGPILAANTVTLSLYLSRDFTEVALLTGYFLLGVGVAGFVFVPSSRIWGKRHLFLLGTVILIFSSAWGGASGKSYKSLLWARIIQGVGCAPFEALVNAAVGDLYFVHERGKRMAFTNLAVFGGAFFTPILVGKITHTIKWWWSFYFVAIFSGACLPAVFFLCPETAYRRDTNLNTDMLAQDESVAVKHDRTTAAVGGAAATSAPAASGSVEEQDLEKDTAGATAAAAVSPAIVPREPGSSSSDGADAIRRTDRSSNESEKTLGQQQGGVASPAPASSPEAPTAIPAKVSWVQSLAIFNGRKTDEQFWKLLIRPLPLFGQPAFLWACLIQGTLIGWTVFIGVILGAFFLGYPLWWDEVRTGYAYTGAFLGALLGFIIAGGLADWSAKVMTRWNGGIYEPEFRIVLVIPQMVFGVMGVFGWGYTSDGLLQGKFHWSIPIMFFGFEVCGMVIGAVASSLYIVDAYRELAIEGFTCMIIFKNFFSFGLTFKAYDWLVENNTKATPVFRALGIVQIIVCVLSVPMYIFGKRNRSFFYRHDILRMLNLR
ncbi:Major facilitator superfamily transporter [Pleurostoma richardsiae]|uniref:Major facilitator superfamily transporter n=1 Tax=Pleurostoma richardsiae TaxID=41990 RepID=A0AA38VLP8_9PEZI|nr:Major facilitator superfamily transporter [Pleurostoma richardsiae]